MSNTAQDDGISPKRCGNWFIENTRVRPNACREVVLDKSKRLLPGLRVRSFRVAQSPSGHCYSRDMNRTREVRRRGNWHVLLPLQLVCSLKLTLMGVYR